MIEPPAALIGGSTTDVTAARDRITAVLAGIEGRDH
jgi:hypothetical protein